MQVLQLASWRTTLMSLSHTNVGRRSSSPCRRFCDVREFSDTEELLGGTAPDCRLFPGTRESLAVGRDRPLDECRAARDSGLWRSRSRELFSPGGVMDLGDQL